MKKQNVLNLIKYHVEHNESAFRHEAITIARYFDKIGDEELAEYVMGMIAEANVYTPQVSDFEGEFVKQLDGVDALSPLDLPLPIAEDIKGIINAVNHDVGINTFLFEGVPGSGKTEAVKHIARLLDRKVYSVDFRHLVDSKLGQTNKNITTVFSEISQLPYPKKTIVLFDEIDVIALDRVSQNDVREMGRATSTLLRELDRLADLNSEVVIIATTNLYKKFDNALTRRFDAIINFNRYSQEDKIEIAEHYLIAFMKKFQGMTKDIRLFRKILSVSDKLPFPGELKNVIKTSIAFSNHEESYEYLRRIYNSLVKNLDETTMQELHKQGFTVREIEILKGESKSSVSRHLNKGE